MVPTKIESWWKKYKLLIQKNKWKLKGKKKVKTSMMMPTEMKDDGVI